MTRFETLDGRSVGVRFCGDTGATFHATDDELDLLLDLDGSTEITSDNGWHGTASELRTEMSSIERAGETELSERFEISAHTSLSRL